MSKQTIATSGPKRWSSGIPAQTTAASALTAATLRKPGVGSRKCTISEAARDNRGDPCRDVERPQAARHLLGIAFSAVADVRKQAQLASPFFSSAAAVSILSRVRRRPHQEFYGAELEDQLLPAVSSPPALWNSCGTADAGPSQSRSTHRWPIQQPDAVRLQASELHLDRGGNVMGVRVGMARERAIGVRTAGVGRADIHVFDGHEAVAEVEGEALVEPVARAALTGRGGRCRGCGRCARCRRSARARSRRRCARSPAGSRRTRRRARKTSRRHT